MSDEAPQAKQAFLDALELDSPEERRRYLDEACGDNTELRARIEALFRAHEHAGNFLGGDCSDSHSAAPVDSEAPAVQIGPFKLLQEIGQGGMGVVYLAEQTTPVRRKVALKIVKPGMDTRQIIARFEAERQALSLMEHPHIAKVLDAGMTSTNRPYFVMELVQGEPITEYCDRRQLTTRQRLELFLSVCHAIQHAHQKGVIHRDIKPSNVLVAECDGRPEAKVIDFGVAKAVHQPLTDKTMFTGLGQVVGTLEYMSPEQAGVQRLDVDTRSDIYSLGVLLYELLTGSTPLDKQRLRSAAWDEMLRIIREEEPSRPSARLSESTESLPAISAQRRTEPVQLTRLVRGELDWIVMKALEKDRARRYDTAAGLADDVRRFLDDEAVQACPPSARYRFRKFARKHKASLTSAALVLAALFLGLVASVWQARNATLARKTADERLDAERKARAEAERQQRRAATYLDQALAAIDQMLTRVSDESLVDAPHMDKLRQELANQAVQLQRNLSRESPEDSKLRRALAHALLTSRDTISPREQALAVQEALATFESLARQTPSDPEDAALIADCHRYLGWALLFVGEPEQGEAACRESLRLGQRAYSRVPDGEGRLAQSRLILGYVLTARGEFLEAESILRAVLPLHEQDFAESPHHWWSLAVNLEKLGVAVQGLGQNAEAEAYYQSAKHVAVQYLDFLDQRPTPGENREVPPPNKYKLTGGMRSKSWARFFIIHVSGMLSDVLEKLGRDRDAEANLLEAERLARELLAEHPDVAEYADVVQGLEARRESLVIDRAQRHESQGALALAVSEYRGLLDKDPRHASTLLRLFHNFMWGPIQDYNRAYQIAQRLVAMAPEDAESWDVMGMAHEALRQVEPAKACFHKAMSLDPQGDRGLGGLVRCAEREGRWDEALALADQAVERFPELAGAWLARADVRLRGGRYDDAIDDYSHGIEVAADRRLRARLHKLRAFARFKLGRFPDALTDIAQSLSLEPTDTSALTCIPPELAASCPDPRFAEGLLALADQAVESGPARRAAICARATLRLATKQYDQATSDLELALHQADDDALIHSQVAWILATCSDTSFRNPARAVELARRGVELAPEVARTSRTRGVCDYHAGDWMGAIAALERAVELRGAAGSYDGFYLAICHGRLDQQDHARHWFEQASAWMEQDHPDDEQLRVLQAEARALIDDP